MKEFKDALVLKFIVRCSLSSCKTFKYSRQNEIEITMNRSRDMVDDHFGCWYCVQDHAACLHSLGCQKITTFYICDKVEAKKQLPLITSKEQTLFYFCKVFLYERESWDLGLVEVILRFSQILSVLIKKKCIAIFLIRATDWNLINSLQRSMLSL